ncbi:ABC-2 type transport system permease protein [Spinactinospora alkalitolerans]|uniref:ABC-2 type transport system permease protein n=1 Tax=Spinactinospora alkalitolerans TaxID=687207 RepID=A0A852TYQ5_9ACTN|nr:ABC transporter [Spinactinospora alkalitolerans]NYE48931.1 ABC-2 type transport system permease protein [Spinactinospora alkalitolerans]
MTTTMTPRDGRPRRDAGAPASGGGLPGAVTAEWTKLWSLRSTWICIGLTLLLSVGVAWLMGYSLHESGRATAMTANGLTPTAIALPQFAIITLASLVVTGEYATGAVRTTLTTVPRRGTALAAKAVVLTATASLTGAAVGLACYAMGALIFGPDLVFEAADLARGVLGTALCLAALSLLTLGLGTALRSTAGTVTAVIGLLLGVPMIAQVVGNRTLLEIVDHTPNAASQVVLSGMTDPYSTGLGVTLLLAWAAAALAAGYAVLRGRDA